jgi:hypothetical protein
MLQLSMLQLFFLIVLAVCLGNLLMLAVMKVILEYTDFRAKLKRELDEEAKRQADEAAASFHPNCRSITLDHDCHRICDSCKEKAQEAEVEAIRKQLGFKPWSKKHAHCKKCHKTDRPHHARGLCRGCWNKQYFRPSRRSL